MYTLYIYISEDIPNLFEVYTETEVKSIQLAYMTAHLYGLVQEQALVAPIMNPNLHYFSEMMRLCNCFLQ